MKTGRHIYIQVWERVKVGMPTVAQFSRQVIFVYKLVYDTDTATIKYLALVFPFFTYEYTTVRTHGRVCTYLIVHNNFTFYRLRRPSRPSTFSFFTLKVSGSCDRLFPFHPRCSQ